MFVFDCVWVRARLQTCVFVVWGNPALYPCTLLVPRININIETRVSSAAASTL